MQQKLAKKGGGPIDRNRDIELLWDFYNRFKKRHRVDDIEREEQKWRESGTFSANIGEYVLQCSIYFSLEYYQIIPSGSAIHVSYLIQVYC